MSVTLTVKLVRRDTNGDLIVDTTAQRVVTLNSDQQRLLEEKGLGWIEYLRTFPPSG